MVTAALVMGLLAFLLIALSSALQVLDDKSEDIAKGAGCVMCPLALCMAVFTTVVLFIR